MKKSIAVLSLILAVNLAAKAHASELPDGELWLAMNADQKIIYLGGWNMATMVLKEYIMLKQAKAKAEREILSEEISRVPEKELLQHPPVSEFMSQKWV